MTRLENLLYAFLMVACLYGYGYFKLYQEYKPATVNTADTTTVIMGKWGGYKNIK